MILFLLVWQLVSQKSHVADFIIVGNLLLSKTRQQKAKHLTTWYKWSCICLEDYHCVRPPLSFCKRYLFVNPWSLSTRCFTPLVMRTAQMLNKNWIKAQLVAMRIEILETVVLNVLSMCFYMYFYVCPRIGRT